MLLNKVCTKVPVGKHLSFVFPIKNGLQQGTVLPLVSALHYHMLSGRSKTKISRNETEWDMPVAAL